MPDPEGTPIAPPAVYYYRRRLSATETLPAVGVALGAGIAAFYLVRLFLQRTPLQPSSRVPGNSGSGRSAVGRPRTRGASRTRPAG